MSDDDPETYSEGVIMILYKIKTKLKLSSFNEFIVTYPISAISNLYS